MSLRSPILILLAPAALLAGCGPSYRGMESIHQPVVARADYSLDLATSGSSLSPGEAQRLAGWFASMRLGYGDRVFVDDGADYAAGAHELIAAEAARYGLLIADSAPVTPGAIAPGTVRVVVTRMQATVPGCPDFRGTDQPNFNAHTSSNYGCATNANLAAMVARPEDLVRGQPGAETSDPAVAVKAITTFRQADPSGKAGLKDASAGGSK